MTEPGVDAGVHCNPPKELGARLSLMKFEPRGLPAGSPPMTRILSPGRDKTPIAQGRCRLCDQAFEGFA
jgi:hypothetical protein